VNLDGMMNWMENKQMSKLDDLIQKLCPDGVEYKTLSEVFDTRNGYTPSKKERIFGKMELYHGSEWKIFVRMWNFG